MIQLRDYQQWAVRWLYDALRQQQSVVWCLPTGAGKRLLAVHLCLEGVKRGRRILVVTNRRLLVDQMVKECEAQGVPYGVIMADYLAGDPSGSVQIASIQTLESWHFYEKFTNEATGRGLPRANLIIVDECHQDLRRYQQLFAFYPDAKIVGLTATPIGAEGKSLVPSQYAALVEGAKNTQLVAAGYLLPTRVLAPSEPNIEGVKIVKRQEYNQKDLGRRVQECTVFADVFKDWAPFEGRKTICFVPGVAYGRDLEQRFNFLLGAGKAHLIHAKTSQKDRDRILRETTEGAGEILISVDVLREGFDLPELSVGVDLQPNAQLRSYWQKVGRIKRPYPGQTAATWLDFAGNYWRFPHPNEDPLWPEGDETTQDLIEKERSEGRQKKPLSCPACYVVYTPTSHPPACPSCGHVIRGEPVRRIRMGSGKLREVPAYVKRKVEKTEEQRLLAKWMGALIRGMKADLTLGQCAVIFKREQGRMPPSCWPGAEQPGTVDWQRKVGKKFTVRSLCQQCRELSERMTKP